LISTSLMDHAGYTLMQRGGTSIITSPCGVEIARIPLSDGLYRIAMPGGDLAAPAVAAVASKPDLAVSIDDLHRRLGHVGVEACREAVRRGMVAGIRLTNPRAAATLCIECQRAKPSEAPFPKESTTPCATVYGGRVHSNVWGQAPVHSIGGREYMLTFTDE
ncbi:hypothetical protein BC834DRAFT_796244, partial [Gloeopeniophorella convolvens]